MINYEPLWSTLKEKGISKYQLIYHWGISSNTLRRMRHNEPISSTTLNELCLILNCKIMDVMEFIPTEEEIKQIETKRADIDKNKRASKKI